MQPSRYRAEEGFAFNEPNCCKSLCVVRNMIKSPLLQVSAC